MSKPIPKTTLEHWAVLATVIDAGSYAQAASLLHKSQPAVSYAIRRLQESLDIELLVPQGRKAVLTPHGATLLNRVRPLLRDFETLEHLAASLKQGWEPKLRLVVDSAFPQERMIAILSEFKATCAETELIYASAVMSGAEEAIVDGAADIVITTHVPPGFLGDWLTDSLFVAVAHRDHPLHALGRGLTGDDLSHHTQVVIQDSGSRNPRDEGWLGSRVRWTVNSIDDALAVLRTGLAFGWLPEVKIASSLSDGTLKLLPLTAEGKRKVPIYLVVARPDIAGPAVHRAVELFQRYSPGPPAGLPNY